MAITLQKGGHVNLSNEAPGLQRIFMNLVWRCKTPLQVHIQAFLLDYTGKLGSSVDIIDHAQAISRCHSLHFASQQKLNAENCPSIAAAELQRIVIDLSRVPEEVEKICISFSLAASLQLKQEIISAHLLCNDARDGAQIANYDFAVDCQQTPTILCGEIFRNGIDWKLRAVGKSYPDQSTLLAKHFGYQERSSANTDTQITPPNAASLSLS